MSSAGQKLPPVVLKPTTRELITHPSLKPTIGVAIIRTASINNTIDTSARKKLVAYFNINLNLN
jgi:hypothetical protein